MADATRHRARRGAAGALAAWALSAGAALADENAAGDELARLSLEELAEVQITSVSRQAEPLKEAASTVFVISSDDIRRSGAISLPEVLRLAPNLNVARIDAGSYAITARGFNSRETSNKLLVLVDGRPIYTTLYSGVPWDTHDVPLADIERIEVISGAGGALYGANAVNGVINIITRSAHDTVGPMATIALGPEEGRATARVGVKLGETGAFRVYVDALEREGNLTEAGLDAGDSLRGVQTGFRADWGDVADQFTVQGDLYDRNSYSAIDIEGHNLLARWTHAFADGSTVELQAYYDRNDRSDAASSSSERTADLHLEHRFRVGDRHQIVWGGGHREIRSDFEFAPGQLAVLEPADQTLQFTNLFVQDQIRVTDSVSVTLGLKAEDGTYAGLEWMPSARISWQASERAFLWASASRAVRTPSRIDRELTLPGVLVGGNFRSEVLNAYEVGYRGRPTERTSVAVSLFHNDYDDLRTADLDPVTVVPFRLSNTARGSVRGVEAWGSWDPTDRWRLSASIALLDKDLEHKPGSLDITGIASGGDDPDAFGKVRSQFDISETVELDIALRAYDELRAVDSYVEADARLGWRVRPGLELSLAGRNLLNDRHIESDDAGRRYQIGRSVWVALRWRP